MGLFGKRKEEKKVAALEGDGRFSYDGVVGESHHRAELEAIIKKGPQDERKRGEVGALALVVADKENKYDSRAVAVFIEGKLVGHIARDQTQTFHDAFAAVGASGYRDDGFYCKAVIGWSGDERTAPIGVRLDLVFGD